MDKIMNTPENEYDAVNKKYVDNSIGGIELDQTTIDTYGTEILKYPLGIWRIGGNNFAIQFTDLPVKTSGRIEITSIDANANKNPWDNPWGYRVYNFEAYNGGNYIRKITSGGTAGVLSNDTGWQRVCTTSVADVPKTKITLDSNIFSGGDVYYEVKNGICYVSIYGLTPIKSGILLLVSDSIPKSNYYILQTLSVDNTETLPTNPIAARILEGSTELFILSNDNTKALYGAFSYPIAEQYK